VTTNYEWTLKVKPNNLNELIKGCQDFWEKKVDVAKCNRYIDHLVKVVPALFENRLLVLAMIFFRLLVLAMILKSMNFFVHLCKKNFNFYLLEKS